jgi:hypothetical protein
VADLVNRSGLMSEGSLLDAEGGTDKLEHTHISGDVVPDADQEPDQPSWIETRERALRSESGDHGGLPISSRAGSSPCRAVAARCHRGDASAG